jgi:hypothetical protein
MRKMTVATIVEALDMHDAGIRLTADGYLGAQPRVARSGIQVYSGAECGRPHMAQVRVYRPESEVFRADTLRSFAHRPITNDHPPELIDASNWKKYAIGQTGDEVLRDGDFIRVPMLIMDAAAIKAVQGGKSQLSAGYVVELVWGSGTTPRGEKYDARQTTIRANHIAICRSARGGSQLRLGDSFAGFAIERRSTMDRYTEGDQARFLTRDIGNGVTEITGNCRRHFRSSELDTVRDCLAEYQRQELSKAWVEEPKPHQPRQQQQPTAQADGVSPEALYVEYVKNIADAWR